MRGMTFEYLFAILGEDMAKWRKNALEEVDLMRTRLLSGPMKGVDQVGIDQLKAHLARAAKCRKDVADATQKLYEDAERGMKPEEK